MLSIIIATYNASNFIEDALNSILRLELDDYEVLIIDGDSTDNTLTIVNDFNNRLPINLVSEKDLGIYDAMNKGIKISKGDHLYFMGADDHLKFDFKSLVECSVGTNKVFYGNVNVLPGSNKYFGKFSTYKLLNCNICHQAIIYPRHVFNSRLYNLKFKLLADYDFNLFLWRKERFEYIDLTVCDFNSEGASSAGDVVFLHQKLTLIKNYFGIFWHLVMKARGSLVSIRNRITGR